MGRFMFILSIALYKIYPLIIFIMNDPNDAYMEKLIVYLKYKYRLNDDDIEEYVDSFNIINKGESITSASLREFVSDEICGDSWTIDECKEILIIINKQINNKSKIMMDLRTYLLYIIPICQEYVITRIGIREIFDSLDENQDDKITCTELISLLYKINREFSLDELTDYKKQIKDLCASADTNKDGYISYEEFKSFILEMGMAYKSPHTSPQTSPQKSSQTSPQKRSPLKTIIKKNKRMSLNLQLDDLFDEKLKTNSNKNRESGSTSLEDILLNTINDIGSTISKPDSMENKLTIRHKNKFKRHSMPADHSHRESEYIDIDTSKSIISKELKLKLPLSINETNNETNVSQELKLKLPLSINETNNEINVSQDL